jgi:uncharacterized protein YoxC
MLPSLAHTANMTKLIFPLVMKRRTLSTCGTKWVGIRQETEELMLDSGMLQEDIQIPGPNADGILPTTTTHTSIDSDT